MAKNNTKKSARQEFVSRKMKEMGGENRQQKQKVAIAYSYAKRAGL